MTPFCWLHLSQMLARGECAVLGGGKAGVEQKPYFQVQNAAGFPIWPSGLLHNRNQLLKETFPWALSSLRWFG